MFLHLNQGSSQPPFNLHTHSFRFFILNKKWFIAFADKRFIENKFFMFHKDRIIISI